MKILVVAATKEEIGGLLELFNQREEQGQAIGSDIKSPESEVDFLITGVGMVATAFALGKHLATHQYNLAINLGIAGSFDRSIQLGELVEVTTDTLIELGAEDDSQFITLDVMGFGRTEFKTDARLVNYYPTETIKQVTAITVNTVHGSEESILQLRKRTGAQLESMEGAAFFYTCEQAGIQALQIRAVSNYVEKRNRDAWKIGLAVKNLNTFAVELLKDLERRS